MSLRCKRSDACSPQTAIKGDQTDLREQLAKLQEEVRRQKVRRIRKRGRSFPRHSREPPAHPRGVVLGSWSSASAQARADEAEATYRKEQQTMLAAWHDLGLKSMRERVVAAAVTESGQQQQQRPYQPQSWLSQQRARANGKGLVRSFVAFLHQPERIRGMPALLLTPSTFLLQRHA